MKRKKRKFLIHAIEEPMDDVDEPKMTLQEIKDEEVKFSAERSLKYVALDAEIEDIKKRIVMEEPKELLEINCDILHELSYSDKLEVLKVRADWLCRQRLIDRVMLRRQEVRAQKVAFLNKGICPNCRKHPVNKGYRMCLMCAIQKSARTRQLRVLTHIFGRCAGCGHLIIPKKTMYSIKVGLRCECNDK